MGLVFDGTVVVGSGFHVLRSWTHFRQHREWRVPFSCFALSDSFSVVPGATCPVFMFYAPVLVFDDTEGIGSHFHILRSRTHFRQYRGRRVSFSYFALLDSFSAVLRATSPIFDGTEVIWSGFHILRTRTHFRRHREWRVPFSCFALPSSFSAVPGVTCPIFMFCAPALLSTAPGASGPIFMFCAPALFFGGIEGVESR
jgi:hypothetical protein